MLNTQRSDDDLFSSSYINPLTSSSFDHADSKEEPSFLNSQQQPRALQQDAGILGISASKNIPQLTQVWMNERFAPELLPYKRSLVEPLIEAIENQVRVGGSI
jgi:hypothetical protein